MLTNIPGSVIATFLLTVVLTFFLFVNATGNKVIVAIILLVWLTITGILSFREVFQNTDSVPPRLLLVMTPAILFIILLLVTKRGRRFTDNLDLKKLTLLHIVRIPVEIVLYLLAAHKLVPGLMTFAGRNFDILSGITAPVMYFFCFRNSQLKNRSLLLVWNFISLALLLNIIINALLSAPFPIQQFAFDQPNIAVLYFPFTWLPCFIVIIVLYSHLAAIRQLFKYR
jgi:hypothetical protein